jgi:hypothetical protein
MIQLNISAFQRAFPYEMLPTAAHQCRCTKVSSLLFFSLVLPAFIEIVFLKWSHSVGEKLFSDRE